MVVLRGQLHLYRDYLRFPLKKDISLALNSHHLHHLNVHQALIFLPLLPYHCRVPALPRLSLLGLLESHSGLARLCLLTTTARPFEVSCLPSLLEMIWRLC